MILGFIKIASGQTDTICNELTKQKWFVEQAAIVPRLNSIINLKDSSLVVYKQIHERDSLAILQLKIEVSGCTDLLGGRTLQYNQCSYDMQAKDAKIKNKNDIIKIGIVAWAATIIGFLIAK